MCLISRWALSASQYQWQLYSAILCFRADPLHSSHMQLWMSEHLKSARMFLNFHQSNALTTLFGYYMAGWCLTIPVWQLPISHRHSHTSCHTQSLICSQKKTPFSSYIINFLNASAAWHHKNYGELPTYAFWRASSTWNLFYFASFLHSSLTQKLNTYVTTRTY